MKKLKNYAYIDGQNLKLGVERGLGWRLDFKKFIRYIKDKYNIEKAYLFLDYNPEKQGTYYRLKKYGYILNFESFPTSTKNEVKGSQEEKLENRAMIDLERNIFHKALIVSGEGSYFNLVKHLNTNNKLEKVISPCSKSCSRLIKRSAKEKLLFLDNYRRKLELTKVKKEA